MIDMFDINNKDGSINSFKQIVSGILELNKCLNQRIGYVVARSEHGASTEQLGRDFHTYDIMLSK